MADDKKDQKTEDQKPSDDKGSGGLTAGDIRKMIGDMVSDAVKTLGGKGNESDSKEDSKEDKTFRSSTGVDSIARQVDREVERIRAKEARDAKDKEIDEKLGKLSSIVEAPPVERRRVHKLMGWGE